MDLYSFDRTGREHKHQIQGMSGNEPVCLIGFIPADTPHDRIAATVKGWLRDPLALPSSSTTR